MKSKALFICLLFVIFLFKNTFCQDSIFAKEIIKQLCSEEMCGRGYSGGGVNAASNFIENKLKQFGVKSFSNNYSQFFFVTANTFPESLKLSVDDVELIPGLDFIIAPESPSIKGEYLLLYIDKNNQDKINCINGKLLKLKRQVVVIDTLGMKNQYKDLFYKWKTVPPTGLAGLIEIIDSKPGSHIADKQSQIPVIKLIRTKISNNSKYVEFCIKAKIESNFLTRNLLAYLPGELDSFIVFTAHYDHIGQLGRNCYFPGANDNASGVAMVLDLIKHYQSQIAQLKYNIVCIFFSAEELGLIGSSYFCDNPVFPLDRIRLLINLDMVGTGDHGIAVVNGKEYPDIEAGFTELNTSAELLSSIQFRKAANNSDHAPFYRKGVKSIFIYSKGEYKEYHNVYDRADTVPMNGYLNIFKFIDSYLINYQHIYTEN
jgi:aminopeptidase YwaD